MAVTLLCLPTLALILLLSAFSAGQQSPPPDLLLINGHVITMDRNQPSAQAIAIRQDRIVWVGKNEEARKLFGDKIRRVDLHGATVLPGIIDAHTHLVELGKSLLRLNLKDVASPEAAVEMVKKQVASTRTDEWILGWGWDEGKWASAYPDNEALSRASPNNPVLLTGLHGFASWANKKALQVAGITKETKDPENGKIMRDPATGLPTGILLNRAQELVEKKIPPMSLEQTKKAVELAARECVRNGLTSVHEARVSAMMLQAFRELIREGRLPLRIYVMLDGADRALAQEWLTRGPEIDPHHHLTIRAFKLFADGALGSRGAALVQPYSDAPDTKGLITTPAADVYGLARSSLQKGFQVCTHAIGDAANRMVLNSYERALHEVPEARNPRFRVEHAQVLASEDIPRFAKLGVIPSMQPTHCTSDKAWVEKRLGPERVKGAYAWRSLLQTGVHLPLSSDFPGETLNPFYGIYAAITRQDPQGNPPSGWYPEQRLTLDEALKGYTVEGAYAEFEEKDKGSIEKGKLADVTVISEDITKLSAKEILSIRVLKTFIGGKVVYEETGDPPQRAFGREQGTGDCQNCDCQNCPN
ncbi:MAG TPA: amidohydrolase [Candidatus Angelobacter sp.]|nr:amidohydrolase [Candidatus Angelobacter sp.]